MLNYALMPLKNYAGFTGRAGRPEFWWYFLATVIANLIVQTIDQMIGGGLAFLPASSDWPCSSLVWRSASAVCTIRTAAPGGCLSALCRSSGSLF